jgi:hypothetical protein
MGKLAGFLAGFPHKIVTVPVGKDFGEFYQQSPEASGKWIESECAHLEMSAIFGGTDSPIASEPDPATAPIEDDWLSEVQDDNTDVPQAATDIEESIYPLDVWDGTAYGDYARICGTGNYIAREFFVESLKTVVGAVVGDQLRLDSCIGPRFYSVLLMGGGKGKSTAFQNAEKFIGKELLYTRGTKPKHINIGACKAKPGSHNGLVETHDVYPRVLVFQDEIATLVE